MTQAVGDYELVRRIGSGGMAEVWMGRRAAVGGATKSVAIKFMASSMANNERHRRMFLDEARLSMMMSHSNVIQVFDAGQDTDRMYMVMEWVDGLNLAQLAQLMRGTEKRWSFSLVGYVIGEVLRGLSYAHNLHHEGQHLGIVHRDISPQNVLISLSGEVKLADFGVARLAVDETSGIHIKGKLRYMAPEHLAGDSKTPSVDLYGAGAILHEMLAGEKFRSGADEMALYHMILGGQLPELPSDDVPPELEQLRRALLQPKKEDRVPSADAALEMLEQWAGYRNAAGELSRLCRSFMGVQAPRSGIHQQALPATDPDRSIETAATGRASSGPMFSAGPASRDETEPGSRVFGAEERSATNIPPGPGTVSTWPPGMDVTHTAVRPRSTMSWVLLGVVGGALAIAGGTVAGVMLLRDSKDDARSLETAVASTEKPSQEADASDDSRPEPIEASPTPSEPQIPTPSIELEPPEEDAAVQAEAAAPEPEADETKAQGEPETEPEPETVPRARTSRPRKRPKKASKPEPPQQEAAPARVLFKLKSPLRLAYVRVDGGRSVALDPVGRIKVEPGRHKIDWRPSEDRPWVSGDMFSFDSGRSYTIRISSRGPMME